MEPIAITSMRQVYEQNYYHEPEIKNLKSRGLSHFRDQFGSFQNVPVENRLSVKILHFYEDNEQNPKEIAIVACDETYRSRDTFDFLYFTIFYKYSTNERRLTVDDIGKTMNITNFLTIRVPKCKLSSEGDHAEDCVEWILETIAIVVSKDILYSSVTITEQRRPSNVLNTSKLTEVFETVTTVEESVTSVENISTQQINNQMKEFIDIVDAYGPRKDLKKMKTTQTQMQSTDELSIDEYSPETLGALIQHASVSQRENDAQPNKSTNDKPTNNDKPNDSTDALMNDDITEEDLREIERDLTRKSTEQKSSSSPDVQEDPMEIDEHFGDADAVGDSEAISSLLPLVNEPVIHGMNVPRFFRENIDIIKFEDHKLEPLNSLKTNSQVSVIGIVKRFFLRSNDIQIDLVDEQGTEAVYMQTIGFSEDVKSRLLQGRLIIMRDLTQKIPVPINCILVEIIGARFLKPYNFSSNAQSAFLYRNELTRACELLFFMFNSIPRQWNDVYINLFGTVLYKKKINESSTEIGLLLPEPRLASKKFPVSGTVVRAQIPEFSNYYKYFSEQVIDKLSEMRHIVKILLYDSHSILIDDFLILRSAIFFGMVVRNDEIILRGEGDGPGNRFKHGKNFLPLDNESFPVQNFWKKMIPILEKLQPSILDDFTIGLTAETDFTTQLHITDMTIQSRPNDTGTVNPPPRLVFQTNPKFIMRHPELDERNVLEVTNFNDLPTLINSPKSAIFVMKAKICDYYFASNNLKIHNLGALRRENLYLVCHTDKCGFQETYEYFYITIAASLFIQNFKMPECPRCHNTLKPHLRIGLTFLDSESTILKMLFMSPFIEASLKCSEEQLMFGQPDERKLVKVLDFLLTSLCPFRNNPENSFRVTERAVNEQNPIYEIYFRKYFLNELPPDRFHPSSELFPNMSSEPFIFELVGLKPCSASQS